MQPGLARLIRTVGVGVGILTTCGGGDTTEIVKGTDVAPHARGWEEMVGGPAVIPTFDPNAVTAGAKATGVNDGFSPVELHKHYGIPFTDMDAVVNLAAALPNVVTISMVVAGKNRSIRPLTLDTCRVASRHRYPSSASFQCPCCLFRLENAHRRIGRLKLVPILWGFR